MAGHRNFRQRTQLRIQQYLALRKLNPAPKDERKEIISWLTAMCNMLDIDEARDMLNHLYSEVRTDEEALIVLNDTSIIDRVEVKKPTLVFRSSL